MTMRSTLLAAMTLALSIPAAADVIHDESVDGDLSNDRFNPTAYTLSAGSNSVIATSQQGDREFIALTIPAGLQLSSLIQVSFVGDDGVAFAGVQAGPVMTVDPDSFSAVGLLGWTHFGPFIFTDGSDILPAMGQGFDADGFVPPLPAGTYTFWLQQAGSPSTFELDFVVTPAPGAAVILGLGALTAARRRR